MTQDRDTDQDKEDEQWLAALAGRAEPGMDALAAQQARAVRSALMARSKALDAQTPVADDVAYQQLLFRLRKERLLGSAKPWDPVVQWGQSKGQMAAKAIASNVAVAWASAGLVVLVVFLLVQNLVFQKSQSDADTARTQMVLRGGTGTVQIVDNPDARAAELMAGLRSAGAAPVQGTNAAGRIRITVISSPAVFDYLATQRLELATPDKEGVIAIVLEKTKK